MKTKLIIILFLILSISCHKENGSNIYKSSLSGFIQKGPFSNGSTVMLTELNSDLGQTGRNYLTQIINNVGFFQIPNIQLESKYISIKADGFYFNEVAGKLSVSQITLYGISDISDKTSININILTHIEKPRIEYLIQKGMAFSAAKNQAEQDILKLFKIDKKDIKESESLDITKSGDDNAILLAISIMLQGNRSEAELMELLSNISNDIKEDGILNDSTSVTGLTSRLKYLNIDSVRKNLIAMYKYLNIETEIPAFEKYIPKITIDTTYNKITFPVVAKYGLNVLCLIDTVFRKDTDQYSYSIAANLPIGTSLIIKYSGNLGTAFFNQGTLDGWDDLGHDNSFVWRTLKSNRSGLIVGQFQVKDTITINYYENGSTTPVRIRSIKVE
jgi:hypothetical protein